MNYATIKNCDVANGPGIRVSLFVSGCTHRCPGCFNEVAWDFDYGHPFDQGVIDLILFDSEGRLCLYDYKTDRLTKEELSDKALAAKRMNDLHGLQLSYYAHAAEQLFGVPCHRLCVYATHSATLYDILPPSPEKAASLLDSI